MVKTVQDRIRGIVTNVSTESGPYRVILPGDTGIWIVVV
jgi:hypothetical protein